MHEPAPAPHAPVDVDDAAVAQLLPAPGSAVAEILSGDDDDEAVLYESDDGGFDAEEPLEPAAVDQYGQETPRKGPAAHRRRDRWGSCAISPPPARAAGFLVRSQARSCAAGASQKSQLWTAYRAAPGGAPDATAQPE